MAASTKGPVAVAVSGGSDSLALMLMAHQWATSKHRDLIILTVDHGLRTEAHEEAMEVVDRARCLGHRSSLLKWSPAKSSSQEAARLARHRLICEASREEGAGLILLGHTRTDFEETLLIRLGRPSTLAGAAGPQPVSVAPVWPDGRGVLLARPLLGFRRQELRDWLQDRGEQWVDDPSNQSDAYERVRVRKLIAHLGGAALSGIADDALRLRALEDRLLAEALQSLVSVDPSGLISLDGLPESGRVRLRFLALLLQVAAGAARPVSPGSIATLADDIALDMPDGRRTLGGAWVQKQAGRVLIGRDPGETDLQWRDGIWDGRYARNAFQRRSENIPFLVRHAVPPGDDWHEIISARLDVWRSALETSAGLSASLVLNDAVEPALPDTARDA